MLHRAGETVSAATGSETPLRRGSPTCFGDHLNLLAPKNSDFYSNNGDFMWIIIGILNGDGI